MSRIFPLFSLLMLASTLISQGITKNDAPNLYIDCRSCDMNYIRRELDYVNYVIDRNDADLFIMITRQSTGGNGRKYTMTLEGHQRFEGLSDSLTYVTDQEMSDDEIRAKTLKWLQLGTVRFLNYTPLADDINISFNKNKVMEQPEDKWDYWVFESSLNGWFDGESTYSNTNARWSFTARRTTEAWKLRFQLRGSYNEERFTIGENEYVSIRRNPGFNSMVVKSISDHFSLGFRAGAFISSYSNLDQAIWVNPTLEYNIFPYQESSRREFRFKYVLGWNMNDYHETTIYDQNEEQLLKEALEIDFELHEAWGSAELNIEGSHYFHDLKKNRLDLRGEISLKIMKGFSYNLHGGYSLIHDQLSLPKGEASQEDILLQTQELETQYSYWGSMGISYTFGSIYNNIVNPRF
ncbi:MAG: hypothetical protein H8E26_10295 [FCB group bacterium]|nr:hypothetical protein [FCB group bacterium]MBL7120951.1 hypothetical protein [Candidatus Neomarinimicrobiota bacterium]